MTARKLLVDACVARAVVNRLRSDGHDVAWVAKQGPDPGDLAILAQAASDGRILITIDTDFGTLVFRDNSMRVGVLRLLQRPAAALAKRASELVEAHGDALAVGVFVTDDGAGVRLSPRSTQA